MSSTSLSEMPFFNISTSQLLEDVLYNSNNIKHNICESSEFYNNILKVCGNNVLQHYSSHTPPKVILIIL